MNQTLRAALCTAALLGASAAHAVPIFYEGSISLPPGETVTGQIGGFGWNRENASQVDFWSFVGYAGSVVRIEGIRVDAGLDPVLDLHYGITGADASAFRTGQSWGGMTFLATGDDENESLVGPFGDPVVTYTLPFTGFYTIVIGGSGSLGEGPYRYNLSVSAVPEVGTWMLMAAGVVGVCWRRRQTSLVR